MIDNILDRNVSTKWLTLFQEDGRVSMSLELNRQVYISSYSLVTANDVPPRDPRKWDIRFNIPQDSK